MTKSGPQKYPPASLKYFYQGRYPGNAMESNVGVIHTTEGTSLPSYDGGVSAPNLTAVPDFANRRLNWFQHFDFDVSSRALVNKAGGVETNTANAVQVELVGSCDPARRTSWGTRRAGVDYLYWPDAPDWALKGVAEFVKWSRDSHGVRAESRVTWKAYPGSYGVNNPNRLTGAQWGAYYGWLGHQHVPENDHGDPGSLDFARVLELVDAEPIPQGPDMAVKPNRQQLIRSEDTQLIPGSPLTLYWTTEYQDDGQSHGDGGKTVATNVCYSSTINLALTGLPEGGYVDVYPVEEDLSGVQTGQGAGSQVHGRVGGGPVWQSVPATGVVANRLAFQVVNRSAVMVTLTEARLSSHFWPNA